MIGATVELRRCGSELQGICPFHDDEDPSLNVNVGKQVFLCRACGAGGDVFEWIQKLFNVGFNESVRLLEGSNGHIEAATRRASPTVRVAPKPDEAERELLLSDAEALRRLHEERHLLPKTLEHFGVVPDFEAQAWTYPVEGGRRFKHYHGRTKQRPKYWCTEGVKNQLYGLADVPDGAESVVWANGELAVWACWQNDVPAVCGFGEGQVPAGAAGTLLAKRVGSVLVISDRDEAGQKGAERTARALAGAGLNLTTVEIPAEWVEGIESADVGDLATVFRSPAQFQSAIERIAREAKPVEAFAHSAQSLGAEQSEQTDFGGRIMWARDLATLDVEAPDPLWEGFLYPGSVHLLSSVAGLDKTTLLLALLSAAAQGKPFVGRPFPKLLRTLYVDLETPQALRREKMLNLWRGEIPDGMAFLSELELPREADHLRRLIAEHRFDVVVIDTLGDAFLTENEDDNAEARREMHLLRDLVRRTGCAVVGVGHLGKEPARGVYSARGASARPAHADVVINLDGDDDKILITVAKSEWGEGKASLRVIKVGDDRFELGDPVPDDYATVLSEAVAIVVAVTPTDDISHGALKKLAVARGIADGTARKAIDSARKRGLIERRRRGVYARVADPVQDAPIDEDRVVDAGNDGTRE